MLSVSNSGFVTVFDPMRSGLDARVGDVQDRFDTNRIVKLQIKDGSP